MGRETRQQRRNRERAASKRPPKKGTSWATLGGVAAVLAVLALFASQVFGSGSNRNGVADKPVDGIPCGQEIVTYHAHAHLTILVKGKPVPVETAIGSGSTNCLYWLHTHDGTGTIHIEAPSSNFYPTLGKFFDVAQYTNGDRVLPAVKRGEHMKVYVNQKPYSGNVRTITLLRHTTITVELGPPFTAPQKYNFGSL